MSRLFAALYDPVTRHAERAGLGAWRTEVLASLSGTLLDAGAGTGANIGRYPAAASRIILTEPDADMRRRLIARVAESGDPRLAVSDAALEQLPLGSGSVDGAIVTLVLCTVTDLRAALREIRRVLRPGGRLAFIEHVAAEQGSVTRRVQGAVQPLWGAVAGGCHLTRDTAEALPEAGFAIEWMKRDPLPTPFPLIRPAVRGIAIRR